MLLVPIITPWEPESLLGRSIGRATHHIRGQSIALLSGVRAVTDGDGIARWSDLTVSAASTRYIHLNFFCEGILASWQDPTLKPPAAGEMPQPVSYVSAAFVKPGAYYLDAQRKRRKPAEKPLCHSPRRLTCRTSLTTQVHSPSRPVSFHAHALAALRAARHCHCKRGRRWRLVNSANVR